MAKKMECSLEALITIVDYSLAHQLKKLYKRDELPFYILSHGYGSATLDIYDLLGFGSPKKLIALSIQSTSLTQQILARLRERIDLYRAGTGIAFTIPLDSSSSILWQICQQADQDNTYAGREDQTMEEKKPYALIVTIVDRGHSDLVMTAAKAAGATGGTLLHGLGLGSREAEKFLGITIQPEKDVILILVPQAKKPQIMEKITHDAGLNTSGRGICFSLPVNAALGLVNQD